MGSGYHESMIDDIEEQKDQSAILPFTETFIQKDNLLSRKGSANFEPKVITEMRE